MEWAVFDSSIPFPFSLVVTLHNSIRISYPCGQANQLRQHGFVFDVMAGYYSVRSYNIGCYYPYERNAKCQGLGTQHHYFLIRRFFSFRGGVNHVDLMISVFVLRNSPFKLRPRFLFSKVVGNLIMILMSDTTTMIFNFLERPCAQNV